MISPRTPRGFTLMELLVVIAIIGVLSSAVLGALREARFKAADAAVRQEAIALRTLLEQERTNSGNYTAIKNGGGWKPANTPCSASGFSGQFATRAQEICTRLVAASSIGSPANSGGATGNGCRGNCLYFQQTGPVNSAEKYAIMAYLPSASLDALADGCTLNCARYFCLGSSGNQSVSDGSAWTEEGCYSNP